MRHYGFFPMFYIIAIKLLKADLRIIPSQLKNVKSEFFSNAKFLLLHYK